ncbi:hypothetical protein [Desulfovibrio sp.]
MSAKLLTTGSAKVRKIEPAKAKAGGSVAGGGRNETGHLQTPTVSTNATPQALACQESLVKKMPPAGKERGIFLYLIVFIELKK